MDKSINSNGLKYNRTDDTVLIKLLDTSLDKYIGVHYEKDKKLSQFIIKDGYFTTEDNAFIFMLDKQVFSEYGITTVVEMLKSECDVFSIMLNVSKLKAVIV